MKKFSSNLKEPNRGQKCILKPSDISERKKSIVLTDRNPFKCEVSQAIKAGM